VANAAAQNSFCSGTTCVITEIYDQSGNGNNLTDASAGGAAGGPDGLANAAAGKAGGRAPPARDEAAQLACMLMQCHAYNCSHD